MLITAERVVVNGQAQAGVGVGVGRDGRITEVRPLGADDRPDRVLTGRMLVPGFVNSQAQVWPRLAALMAGDAAGVRAAETRLLERLQPDALLAAARLALTEMLLDGVTTVTVMHGLHYQANGIPYDEPVALADAVIKGARDAGIRLSLVRAIGVRARDAAPASVAERRSSDVSVEVAADELLRMAQHLLRLGDNRLGWGLGAQSPTSVSLHGLIALKTRFAHAPFHLPMHEPAEEQTGSTTRGRQSVLERFATANLVDSCTVLTNDRELTEREKDWTALLGASVCVIPSGAGSQAGRQVVRELPICLGSGACGSVRAVARAVTAATGIGDVLAQRSAQRTNGRALFSALTRHGAAAAHVDAGAIEPGRWADLATFDLNHPVFAGALDDDLVARLVASGPDLAPRDVAVAGRWVVEEGVHLGLKGARRAAEAAAATLAAN